MALASLQPRLYRLNIGQPPDVSLAAEVSPTDYHMTTWPWPLYSLDFTDLTSVSRCWPLCLPLTRCPRRRSGDLVSARQGGRPGHVVTTCTPPRPLPAAGRPASRCQPLPAAASRPHGRCRESPQCFGKYGQCRKGSTRLSSAVAPYLKTPAKGFSTFGMVWLRRTAAFCASVRAAYLTLLAILSCARTTLGLT